MRVVMRTHMAGPDGSAKRGEEVDLPEKRAKELIAGRYAVAAKPSKRRRAPETAMRGGGENASRPAGKARGEDGEDGAGGARE